MNIVIETKDLAGPELKALLRKLGNPKRINGAVAKRVQRLVVSRMRLNAATNKNPYGVRGSFWNRMISSTVAVATEEAATVRMPGEMRLRVKGGTVKPKTTKYLTIPATKEAYGKSARDFDDLRFAPLFGRGKGGALIQRDQTKLRKKKDGSYAPGKTVGGKVFYWLKTEATIKGDRTLLPRDSDVVMEAEAAIREVLKPADKPNHQTTDGHG
jgi:hypothetical protein